MYSINIKGDNYKFSSLNEEIGESLSGKRELAAILAPSCLAPMLDVRFLLIHAARCKRHVALTSLILFPLSCSHTTTHIHRRATLGVKQRGNEHDATLIDHLNN